MSNHPNPYIQQMPSTDILHQFQPIDLARERNKKAFAICVAIAVLGIWVCTGIIICWENVFLTPYGEQPFGPTAMLGWPNDQKTFTVLQIADTQIGDVASDVCKNIGPHKFECTAYNTTRFVSRLVRAARPDLVVFTGDQVERPKRPRSALQASWAPVKNAHIPFVVLTGNHDISRCDVWTYADAREYIHSHALLTGTSMLKVMRNGTEHANLWFFDYNYDSEEATGSEIDPQHMAWFKQRSTASGADGLVMLHVPPKEVTEWPIVSGVKQEEPAISHRDSGLVAALPPSIRAVAFGHDHTNDYCVRKKGQTLCYAGAAGYTTYGRNGWPRRARVFEFYRNGSMSTHKRLDVPGTKAVDFLWL